MNPHPLVFIQPCPQPQPAVDWAGLLKFEPRPQVTEHCQYQDRCGFYLAASASLKKRSRHKLLTRAISIARVLTICVVCFGLGLIISPIVRAQSASVIEQIKVHQAEQDGRANTEDAKLSDQSRRLLALEASDVKSIAELAVLSSDVSLIKGIGIGLAAILVVLQVIQTVSGKMLKREA